MKSLASLDQLPTDASGVVRQLNGGQGFASRLAAMGLVVGAPLVVRQNAGHGAMLVEVRDTRIALGRSEAKKILVEEAGA